MAGGPSAGRRRVPTAVLLVALIMALAGCDFSSAVTTPSTAVPIRLLLFDGGTCLLAGFPARLTFRIDAAATEPVTAIDETLLAELEELTAKGIPGFLAVAEAAAATRR